MLYRKLRVLAAALLLSTVVMAGAARADDRALYQAAKGEGTLTWYISHYAGDVAQDVANAFTAKYPGVTVNVVRATAQVVYQRLNQDIGAGNAICDVFGSTDIGHYVTLQRKGLLAEYVPDDAAQLAPLFAQYAKAGFYYPTSAGLVMLTYNTKLVPAADAPKNWPDLLDPRWKGKVAVGHPGFSGYVGTWVVEMRKLYGWDYFKKLAANDPLVGRSINDTVTSLNSGERVVAAGPDQTTLESASRGNPVGIIYPTDGAVLMISPSAVIKSAPHPNAARLFEEFLMSPEYSQIMVRYKGVPMRTDVAPPPGMKPLTEVKTVRPSEAEIVSGIPEVIEDWRDVFGN